MELATDISSVKAASLTSKQKVLELLKSFPYRTARELAHKVNQDVLTYEQIHKRLPELATEGKVARATLRKCTVSNLYAQTWVAL